MAHEKNDSLPHTGTHLRGVENNWRETRRHFTVQTNLDTSLNLVLCLHERIQEFVRVDDGLAVVGHQSNQRCVPFVDDLGESSRARAHENLPDAVIELLNAWETNQHDATMSAP